MNSTITPTEIAAQEELRVYAHIPNGGKFNTDTAIELALRLAEGEEVFVVSWEKKYPLRIYVYKQMAKNAEKFGIPARKIIAEKLLLRNGETVYRLRSEPKDQGLTEDARRVKLVSPEDIQI